MIPFSYLWLAVAMVCFSFLKCRAQTDTSLVADSITAWQASEEALQDMVILSSTDLVVRLHSSLVTFRERYNSSLYRTDNKTRVSHLTSGLHLAVKSGKKTIAGFMLTARRLKIGDRSEPILHVFKTDNGPTRADYLRNVALFLNRSFQLNKMFLLVNANFQLPLNDKVEVTYEKFKNRDPIYRQASLRFILTQRFSPYVSLNSTLIHTYRFTSQAENKSILRLSLMPVFMHRLFSRFYLLTTAEINCMLYRPFFNSFYLNETIALVYTNQESLQASLTYGCYALGKNVSAQHLLTLSVKKAVNFTGIK
jgi:hypothetical protein